VDKIHFLADLNRHLSFYQLICVLAHMTQSTHLDISYRKLISGIHILIATNFKGERSNKISNGDLQETHRMPSVK
jgi:hypothetical protein